jgi:hypothetical protein
MPLPSAWHEPRAAPQGLAAAHLESRSASSGIEFHEGSPLRLSAALRDKHRLARWEMAAAPKPPVVSRCASR